MKTDIVFENLKAGQKLYSLMLGEVEVKALDKSKIFPIICNIPCGGDERWKDNGKLMPEYKNYDLFLTNPFEKLNQERVIEVKNGSNWIPRVCIKVVDREAICWYSAKTLEEAKNAKTIYTWSTWRELQPEQPAAEQPKEITIDGVEYTLTPKTK